MLKNKKYLFLLFLLFTVYLLSSCSVFKPHKCKTCPTFGKNQYKKNTLLSNNKVNYYKNKN